MTIEQLKKWVEAQAEYCHKEAKIAEDEISYQYYTGLCDGFGQVYHKILEQEKGE